MKKLVLELPEGLETQVIPGDGSLLDQAVKDMQLIAEGKARMVIENVDPETGHWSGYVQVWVGPREVN